MLPPCVLNGSYILLYAESMGEAKKILEEVDVILDDAELDQVSGGRYIKNNF